MVRFLFAVVLGVLGAGSVAIAAGPGGLAYRCVHLAEDSSLEGVQIFRNGSMHYAVFRYLAFTGEFVEKRTKLDLSRVIGDDVETLTFSGNGVTVDLDLGQPIEPGKYSARIYVRELALQTAYAACKAF